ncbi:MAG: HD-GYP domain-containing protein [Peptococcaceae bacterium]|nr:HD-GYP domain-containing protein [Peptococcaceae bacterium]
MRDTAEALIEKLNVISLTDKGPHNEALTSFLLTLEDIVGTHSIRVGGYAVMTGREMALPEEKLTNLHIASLLHDIGKLFIPTEILHKTDNLNEQELDIIRNHPVYGQNILLNVAAYEPYADIILYHHEFFNGRGYPCGLSGSDIPLLSRIIAVADAYEAMTSERPYRKGFSHREAVIRLRAGRYTQFDPEITNLFLKAIKRYSRNGTNCVL